MENQNCIHRYTNRSDEIELRAPMDGEDLKHIKEELKDARAASLSRKRHGHILLQTQLAPGSHQSIDGKKEPPAN